VPQRFPAFTDNQAQQLAMLVNEIEDRIDLLRKRIFVFICVLGLFIAIGLGFGIYAVQEGRHEIRRTGCNNIATLVTIAIPPNPVPGRTPAQIKNVDKFYAALRKAGLPTSPEDC
jgi:hypothetical protein